MNPSRRSFLQVEILLELKSSPAKTITELAERVKTSRPSVSRSMHNLKQQGLVKRDKHGWYLTEAGEEEAQKAQTSLLEATEGLKKMADRTFDAMSKIVIPDTFVQNINKMLTNSMEPYIQALRENNKRLLDGLSKAMSIYIDGITKNIQDQFSGIGKSFSIILNEMQTTASQIAPALAKADIWFSPSMTLEPFYQLKKLTTEGEPSKEMVVGVFVDYLEEDNWAELHRFVNSWEDNPIFAPRMRFIKDALDAHIGGKFTLSVPVLLAQAEGIASDILDTPAGDPTRLLKEVINEDQGNSLSVVSRDIFLRFVISPAGFGSTKSSRQDFTTANYSNWLRSKGVSEDQSLNRHGILHGVHLNYASKENSIRAFLLLDMLYFVNRYRWNKKMRLILKERSD